MNAMKQRFGARNDEISMSLTSCSVFTPTVCAFLPSALIRLLFDVTPPHDSLFSALLGPYHSSCKMGPACAAVLISSLLKKKDETEGEVLKGRISMWRQSSVKLLQMRAAEVTYQHAPYEADSLCLPVSPEP